MVDFRFESLEALSIMGACFVVDVRCECLEALSFKGACFVIDVRFESLEALRFKGACFVIDFRCESLEAIIFMGVNWPRFLGRDNTMHRWQSHQSGRTPNLSLKLQPPSDFGYSKYRSVSESLNYKRACAP